MEQAAAGSGELVGLVVGARVVVVPSSPSAPGVAVVGVSARPVIRQAQRGDHQQDRALPPVAEPQLAGPGEQAGEQRGGQWPLRPVTRRTPGIARRLKSRQSQLAPLPAGSTSGSRTRLRPRRQQGGAAETLLWVALGIQLGALPIALPVALWAGGLSSLRVPRSAVVLPVGGLSVLNLAGDASLSYAVTGAELAVVSVLASLAPVVTVLLVRAFTAERLSRLQGVGVALAVVGTSSSYWVAKRRDPADRGLEIACDMSMAQRLLAAHGLHA